VARRPPYPACRAGSPNRSRCRRRQAWHHPVTRWRRRSQSGSSKRGQSWRPIPGRPSRAHAGTIKARCGQPQRSSRPARAQQ
jgi:hypothetical protein